MSNWHRDFTDLLTRQAPGGGYEVRETNAPRNDPEVVRTAKLAPYVRAWLEREQRRDNHFDEGLPAFIRLASYAALDPALISRITRECDPYTSFAKADALMVAMGLTHLVPDLEVLPNPHYRKPRRRPMDIDEANRAALESRDLAAEAGPPDYEEEQDEAADED